jgi:putative nucleotidyltransferase with HDIG domain
MKAVEEIFSGADNLPPAPALLPKLLPALEDVNANFDDIVDMIELDQTLTAKLLQICNSAFFSPPRPVTDVREAVSQAGYEAVYLLAAMISGSACFVAPEVPGVNSKLLWKHSVAAAYAAKFVAESALMESELLFTAGLLHDIGRIVFARAHGASYGLLLIRATLASSPASPAEITAYGCSHAEIGAQLLERWKLPAELVAGVRFHHEPATAPKDMQRIAACVCVGNALVHSQQRPESLDEPEFKTALELLHLAPDNVKDWQQSLREYEDLIETMSKMQAEKFP